MHPASPSSSTSAWRAPPTRTSPSRRSTPSPEQCAGHTRAIDIRSDIYSLGVVLYELLTGRRPYEISDSIPDAVLTIRESFPQRPSAVAPALRGDVETILLKALEKEPDRR